MKFSPEPPEPSNLEPAKAANAVHGGISRIVTGLYIGFWVGLWRGIRALLKKKNSKKAITILLDRLAGQINRMDNPNNPVPQPSLVKTIGL